MKWPNPAKKDLMSEETRPAWLAYRKNPHNGVLPDHYIADMVWSREYIGKLIRDEPADKISTVTGPRMFASSSASASSIFQVVPRMMSTEQLEKKIKEEKAKAWLRRASRAYVEVIDLLEGEAPVRSGSASSSNTESLRFSASGLVAAQVDATSAEEKQGTRKPVPHVTCTHHTPSEVRSLSDDTLLTSDTACTDAVVHRKKKTVTLSSASGQSSSHDATPLPSGSSRVVEKQHVLVRNPQKQPSKRQRGTQCGDGHPQDDIKREIVTEFHAAALTAVGDVVSLLDEDIEAAPAAGPIASGAMQDDVSKASHGFASGSALDIPVGDSRSEQCAPDIASDMNDF